MRGGTACDWDQLLFHFRRGGGGGPQNNFSISLIGRTTTAEKEEGGIKLTLCRDCGEMFSHDAIREGETLESITVCFPPPNPTLRRRVVSRQRKKKKKNLYRHSVRLSMKRFYVTKSLLAHQRRSESSPRFCARQAQSVNVSREDLINFWWMRNSGRNSRVNSQVLIIMGWRLEGSLVSRAVSRPPWQRNKRWRRSCCCSPWRSGG